MGPLGAVLLVAMLIAANGLFVAAEFGLVAARRGAIEEAAAGGDRRARMALRELRNLSFVLSGAQFGITATSLVVGFLAEGPVAEVVIAPMLEALGLPASSRIAVSVTVAFLLTTIVQMLFGELAPKNLAIARPERVSLAVAPFMRGFGWILGPVIRMFDGAAEWVSRRVLRVERADELLGGHSVEELSRIISASAEEGVLTEVQSELLSRAVELGETRVSEVMVPRPDVSFLPADATLVDLREATRQTGHSRFPVRGASEDDVLGTVHIKDVLQVSSEAQATTTVGEIATLPLVVPESESVHRLLGQMRGRHRTFAVVVDEYGGTAGIVTIEDVLEELVGEIEDEFDREVGHVRRLGAGRFVVRGDLRADRLGAAVGATLPEGEYETVAGFVIDRLGHIPAPGESVTEGGWELTVRRLEGVRVAELTVQPLPDPEPAGEDPA